MPALLAAPASPSVGKMSAAVVVVVAAVAATEVEVDGWTVLALVDGLAAFPTAAAAACGAAGAFALAGFEGVAELLGSSLSCTFAGVASS